jgi:hypothetical protein
MGKYIDLTGQKFDRLTVIERDKTQKDVKWICRCDCGNLIVAKTDVLKAGKKRSCGCLLDEWRSSKHHDIIGNRYGKVVVIGEAENKGRRLMYKCQCDCGNIFETRKDGLLSGHTTSCGCSGKEWRHSGQLNRKHGLYEDRAYWLWAKVRARCYNPNAHEYPNYGGRGIKMCDEWQDAENFVKWCYENGYDSSAPKGVCTLERIDVNGNYEPSNCCFKTNLEQQNNRRNNVFAEYKGKRQTIAQWSRELNIPYTTLYKKVVLSEMSIEQFLNDYVPRGTRS